MALRLFSKSAADSTAASKNAPERKSVHIQTGIIGMTSPGRAVWSGRNSWALTRNGFLSNPVAYRCIKMIAEAVGSAEMVLQDEGVRYTQHPVLSLLARPNSGQSGNQFIEELTTHLLLSGDGYARLVWDDEKPEPVALHVLRSDRVSVVPGQDGWPEAYEYQVGNQKTRFVVDETRNPIIHIRVFHPQDDYYGLSPLHAGASAVDVHNAASQWSKALLDNAARPSGAIIYKGPEGYGNMSNDQYSRLVDEIEVNHQGARNAGRPMLLEGGLDWKPMGFSPSDMEFHRTKEAAAREIALALGVPPMLLGLPGDNTYSNYQEANRAFFRLTILPLMKQICSAFEHSFVDKTMRLRIDMDAIPALASEREADWSRISNADFLSESEKRQLLGFPAQKES